MVVIGIESFKQFQATVRPWTEEPAGQFFDPSSGRPLKAEGQREGNVMVFTLEPIVDTRDQLLAVSVTFTGVHEDEWASYTWRLNSQPSPTPTAPLATVTGNWITPLPAPIHSLRLKGQVAYTILLDQTHIYWMVDGNFGHIFRYPLAGGEVETIATSQFADGNLNMYLPIRTGDWLIVLDTRTYDDRVWEVRALNLRDKSDTVVTQGNGSTVMRGLAADGDWVAWALLEESASCTGTDAQTVLAVHNLKSGEQRELDRACADEYMWLWPGLSGNRLVAAGSDGLHLFDLTSGQRTTLTTDLFCEPTISEPICELSISSWPV